MCIKFHLWPECKQFSPCSFVSCWLPSYPNIIHYHIHQHLLLLPKFLPYTHCLWGCGFCYVRGLQRAEAVGLVWWCLALFKVNSVSFLNSNPFLPCMLYSRVSTSQWWWEYFQAHSVIFSIWVPESKYPTASSTQYPAPSTHPIPSIQYPALALHNHNQVFHHLSAIGFRHLLHTGKKSSRKKAAASQHTQLPLLATVTADVEMELKPQATTVVEPVQQLKVHRYY